MTFSQLTPGSSVHVLEITGTFKKNTVYNLGTVVFVSNVYEEPLPPGQFPMPNQIRRKLVDITISCDGEQKKLSLAEDKSIMTDNTIGLTVATGKDEIIKMVQQSYNDCKRKKEMVAKYDEEIKRCEEILKQLNYNDVTEEKTNSNKEFDELKQQVTELKKLLLETVSKHKEETLQPIIQPPVGDLSKPTEEQVVA